MDKRITECQTKYVVPFVKVGGKFDHLSECIAYYYDFGDLVESDFIWMLDEIKSLREKIANADTVLIRNETIGSIHAEIGRNKFVVLPRTGETAEISQKELGNLHKKFIEQGWISTQGTSI